MLKACLDTNVLLSGITHSGIPSEIVNLALQKKFRLITSTFILEELERNLIKKFDVASGKARKLIDRIANIADMYDPKGTIKVIKECSSDNLILETAWIGRAKYLVTGDKRHLIPIKVFRNIKILGPSDFIELIRR